ncbi:GNAT family N-acetyltransferase [Chitinimonas arctica]|uniref:Acyl-homoserine-lactone synthase n=1 Tax=Chitinimonas arctica TaxID=2594795 RepID=A0A516SCD4_9NEIS|nr:acyl-homoserine-lactone synthase [Chitinimonas arctica]QDQ25804.1 GNAT family N-acetyltransferase [Chitinimonas arctica]
MQNSIQMIQIGQRQQFNRGDLHAIHSLRARVFRDRMGWEVPILAGMEIDGYDALEPHYMVIRNQERQVFGCWRLLPTLGPYMLKDTFPALLHGSPAPEEEGVWELSRFAIETDGSPSFGFADQALDAMREIVRFADEGGIKRYVTVTTTAIERMLRRAGIEISRFGPPIRIGVENAVALTIELGEQTHSALFGLKH